MEYTFKIIVKTDDDPKSELVECDMFLDEIIGDTETQELSITLPLPISPELVGEQERKKMIDSLLEKARTGEL